MTINWTITGIVAAVVIVAILIAWGVSEFDTAEFSEKVKTWTVQEAVFYGCCVIAFATFVR